MKKNFLFLIIILVIFGLAAGFFYFKKIEEINISEKEQNITKEKVVANNPKITDEEIIVNFKNYEYGLVVEKINPFNESQSIIVLSSFMYKKSGEPLRENWDCGTRAVTQCYILSKMGDKIKVIYRTDSPEYSEEWIYLFKDEKGKIPFIKFLNAEEFVIKSYEAEGYSGNMTFIKINSRTKESSAILKFNWGVTENMPIVSFLKIGKMIIFKDPTCVYIGNIFETKCDNKIALFKVIKIDDDGNYVEEKISEYGGDFKKSVIKLERDIREIIPIVANNGTDFSFDLEKNIYNGNKLEFWINGKDYVYNFDEDKIFRD